MSRTHALIITVLMLIFASVPALAGENAAPDVTGVWKGTSDSVALGKLGHVNATKTPTFLHADFTLTIEKQEGLTFYGSKASAKAKEILVGVIDGNSLYMADEDGVFIGELKDPNTLIVKYLEPGKESKVASITTFHRQ